MKMIDAFMSHTSPLRFGLVMAVSPNKKVTGSDDAGVALLCAFNYVIQNNEEKEDANFLGLKFLINVR